MTTRRSGTRIVLLCVVLLAGAATAAAPGAATTDGPEPGVPAVSTPADDIVPDRVLLHVRVRPDGTAAWQVEYRFHLDDDNRTEAFESLRADVESNPEPHVQEFLSLLEPSVDRAANATGRDMRLRNGSVTAARQPLARPTGVVTYRFEWTAFAVTNESTLRVGDAISGFYVDAASTLLISWPEGYTLASVRPEPTERRDGSVLWRGPTEFGRTEPRLAIRAPGETSGPFGLPLSMPVSIAVGLALAAVATLGLVGRTGVISSGTSETGGSSAAPSPATPGDASESAGEDTPPPELLSNEERVLAALEANGGRMKQQVLAETLEWGAPKTSRVVGSLREAEEVEVFRLGRENVVTLPGEGLLE